MIQSTKTTNYEHAGGSSFYVQETQIITDAWRDYSPEISDEIFGAWVSENSILWSPDGGTDGAVKAMIRVKPEPTTIKIFHEPIKPSKSAAIAVADGLVANVESMLASGHMTNDDLALVLEQTAAAKEMANKAYDEVRDLMGKRLGQNYLYGSGSKFEVKGGNKMSYDYSNCDSIKEFDNDLNVLDTQIKALKAAKSAREKQIASAYEAQRYGDLKRVDPETGVEYSDIPTPIPGNTTYAFTLAK
jgi:hypothetical protein